MHVHDMIFYHIFVLKKKIISQTTNLQKCVYNIISRVLLDFMIHFHKFRDIIISYYEDAVSSFISPPLAYQDFIKF